MKQIVIENPVLNSPFAVPTRHWKFTDEGITNEKVERRRPSAYFVPIPPPKKKGKQLEMQSQWTQDRVQTNPDVDKIRIKVSQWRQGGYVGITKTTSRLLEYWTNPNREKKLFFCQIEAVETAIYLAEVASKFNDGWIEGKLRECAEANNPDLYRIALKMATGSGKTVVMAMLIAWQALNKIANQQDARFTDSFLIVTPGITIRDRLRVLIPNSEGNYYDERDLLTPEMHADLQRANVVITNFHAFKPREREKAGKLTKSILAGEGPSPFTETPAQMVRRVCRELAGKKNILVINDEAHHCYRRKAEGVEGEALLEEMTLKGDERKEAERREEEARVWISGLEAVQKKIGIKAVYDLSATPFFLKGSGYPEGTLFPWVVSDFSLIDAIESGIVKVPRVPVADDSMTGVMPTYRDLWLRIRDDLPKKGRGEEAVKGEPKPPTELEGALRSLYGNYEKYYKEWEKKKKEARARGATPPVFIIVCNNTNVSKLVYDFVSGWDTGKRNPDETPIFAPGHLNLFSNVDSSGHRFARPNTILVDSGQLESGEGLSADFKKLSAREIEEFKDQFVLRFPGRNKDDIGDDEILREVMNTVGKPGKLGEQVRCVVSVSMLTEGWDVNTVTHILGIRAFGTQLLCEQVVGRGLRRMNYGVNKEGYLEPEYAEVYGVPFSFIPCSGSTLIPKLDLKSTRIKALEERAACEITFPRLLGYRFELPADKLMATFTDEHRRTFSTQDLPTKTENAPIVGETSIHNLDDLKARRTQEVEFLLAKLVLEKYFRRDGTKKEKAEETHHFDSEVEAWLFPQILRITREWLLKCVVYKDDTFPQLLLLTRNAHDAADRIYRAIAGRGQEGGGRVLPILRPYDTVGSSRYVNFDTVRDCWPTRQEKCHVNYMVADTRDWEQKLAQSIEDMDEVIHYVKNDHLGFTIPYSYNGQEKNYVPDFILHVNDGHGPTDLLNFIVEVSGEAKDDKAQKVATARDMWVPAVNNHGGYGRWAFLQITDPWSAKAEIRKFLQKGVREAA